MIIRSAIRAARIAAACAVLGTLALPSPGEASWSRREPVEHAGRLDVFLATVVPGAPGAGKPRRDAASDASRSAALEPDGGTPVTATAAGPGQAGYVHYFLLRLPDGTAEMQVGIELPDQSIAWAVPGFGVMVSPFIESGSLAGPGGQYEMRHLFGIRPFPGEAAMAELASALPSRVMPWIDDGVQHCDVDPPPRGERCVSCLGFVLRVLFPGRYPTYPALPEEFRQAGSGERYTTEDLLIYLAGLHKVATREARVARIQTFDVPRAMRDELLRVVAVEEAVQHAEPQPAARARGVKPGVKAAARKPAQRPRRL